ncbi:MAG TPA: NimC/NimA family protein [Desulfitobacterium dehalogenans]|uniref:NimC/NimA family protein n=1 Tax=Desulfitobacterium dehalogenans TaxID=36854 RepID=A0A7C7D791_9FIRM|nr:NimC/NimA family protein [Desulfitobacterium dehalogenans]
MQEVYEFLKQCGTYYLATQEGDQPRVRPFGTVNIFENKLYIQTGKVKDVYRQLKANPKIEICAVLDGSKWIRVAAVAVEDDRLEAKQDLLDAYPSLQGMYKADDDNTIVFYLKDATATFSSFTEAPRVITF